MLKKLSLIIIIAVLAYSHVGYYFVLRLSQDIQREAIKEKLLGQLKDEELEIISLSDNRQKISWEEDGKEFLLNGKMYDVVKSKTINGKVMLFCINDKKEKELVDEYNLITGHNSSSDKKGKSNIDNSFNLFVYQEEKAAALSFTTTSNRFALADTFLPENLPDNISPPPKKA